MPPSSKKPPSPAPAFVNWRGEVIDLRTLRAPAAAPALKPQPMLEEADTECVFDALCLAGCARSKTWLFQFMRALERKTSQGNYFTAADVDAALRSLRANSRVTDADGIGLNVPPALRDPQLPRLLSAEGASGAWKAWARAGSHYAMPLAEPPRPDLRYHIEAVAFARLILYSGMSLDSFRITSARFLGQVATAKVLAEALCSPFMPTLFERMDPALRDTLLQSLEQHLNLGAPAWQALRQWLDEQVARAPGEVAPALRFAIAQGRLHLGDLAGAELALVGMSGIGLPLLRAAMLGWRGQWRDATAAFVPVGSLRDARLRFERDYIAAVLQHHGWRMADAAQTLGIQRPNLYRKARQLGIPLARVSE